MGTAVSRIGPNAVLQHLPVLDAEIGEALRGALLHRAGIVAPPLDAGMLPEADVACLHDAVRLYLPDRFARIQRAAGLATGDYILAHRIPAPAQRLIRALPGWAGARLLSAAIARHAWTFAGSGQFRILTRAPLRFEIAGNPLVTGPSDVPLCHWHAAVFERLFARLVWPDIRVVEERCRAQGDDACVFALHSGKGPAFGSPHPPSRAPNAGPFPARSPTF
ncbi:MAG: bacteriochlorophyll 4-vinyl reductase [Rhodobacteraceae bacterium]|nr:MAG: bacteriochlorophyll 4-vinyl reductase [Paracoccaceae bacterium]